MNTAFQQLGFALAICGYEYQKAFWQDVAKLPFKAETKKRIKKRIRRLGVLIHAAARAFDEGGKK